MMALSASLAFLFGCARPPDINPSAPAEAAAATDAPNLASQQQRLSYALGMTLGKQFREQAIAVDVDLHARGLRDALAGDATLLSEVEARAAVAMLQRELKRAQSEPPPAATGIEFSFRLDSRLTRGMYLGDRWVSPPLFTLAQEGREAVVAVRAQVVGAQGRSLEISPEWIPEDPGMVTVSPGTGDEVRITVQRPGQSRLKVFAAGVSRELLIKATQQGSTLLVEIAQ